MIENIRTRKSADISLKLSLAFLACLLASAYGFAATSINVDFGLSSPRNIVDDIVVCPQPRSKINDNAIVIRSTSFEDLPTVVDLLAFESIPKEVVPFFRNLQIAKNRNAFKIQLKDRLDAIKFTSKAIQQSLCGISSSHTLSLEDINNYRRLIWNHDGIRNRVERAVKTTQEYSHIPTKWDNYNFALVPEPSMLYHFMISAYDNDFVGSSGNGNVVGFCEVMMMNAPNGEVVPSIINLAVSPNHRRRGIGTRMLYCALRRVRLDSRRQQEAMFVSHMMDHERSDRETNAFQNNYLIPNPMIGLQVHVKNQGAIHLYEKVGFQIKSEDHEMIYMEMDL